jgi:hypothetical protein
VHKPQSFPPNVGTLHLMFGGQLVVSRVFEKYQQPAIQTKIVQHFGGFFHQIKVCQQMEKWIQYMPPADE